MWKLVSDKQTALNTVSRVTQPKFRLQRYILFMKYHYFYITNFLRNETNWCFLTIINVKKTVFHFFSLCKPLVNDSVPKELPPEFHRRICQ